MKPSIKDFVNHDEGVFKYPALLRNLVPIQLAYKLCDLVPCNIVTPHHSLCVPDSRLGSENPQIEQDPYHVLKGTAPFIVGLQGYFNTPVNTMLYFGGELYLFSSYMRQVATLDRPEYNFHNILLPVIPVIFPLVRNISPQTAPIEDIPEHVYNRLLENGYGIRRYLFVTLWSPPDEAYCLNAILTWLRFKQMYPETKPLIYSGEMASPIIREHLHNVVTTYNQYIAEHPNEVFLPGEIFLQTTLAQHALHYIPYVASKRFECAYRWAIGDDATYEQECNPDRLQNMQRRQVLVWQDGRYVEKPYAQVLAEIEQTR